MFNEPTSIRDLAILNSVWGVLLRLVLWIGTPVLSIWFYEIWWLPLTIGSILIFLIRPNNLQDWDNLKEGMSPEHEAEAEAKAIAEAKAKARAREKSNYEYFEELQREDEERLEREHMNRVFNSTHWH